MHKDSCLLLYEVWAIKVSMLFCLNAIGICSVRVPDFWTKVGVVNFNFSGLSETNPDRLSDYQWGLGDVPGEVNVISIQSVERTTSYFREYNIATLVHFIPYGKHPASSGHLEFFLPCQPLLEQWPYTSQ